jgi:hypothetical protein
MADQNTNLVYTLGVQAGIKRDGTTFESREFSDGEWCRFQRGVPKKIGGYRQMFRTPNGIPRGMIVNPYNGIDYIFIGNSNGVDVFTSGTNLGLGSGPYQVDITNGLGVQTVIMNTSNSFTVAGDQTAVYTTGAKVIFDQTPGATVYTVTGATYTTDTVVSITPVIASGTPTQVWLAEGAFTQSPNTLWQFDLQYSPLGGNLQVLAHPGQNLANIDNGVPNQVLIGSILPGANQTWSFTGLADTGGQNPTNRPISVDGGVCVLYPFVFVYGSNGYIANNNVSVTDYATQTPTDWNGPLANQVNMSSSKIVKGMPVRGGTNSPSGLFWALDSLIRVSFTGQQDLYWRYDIISSQISIMSSNSVVEMDGVYFWMGTDRFYAYNGSVSVLPNDKNVNWLFDNINFQQRQKVWATKVPRYNEIWFFYPRGTATECTDAIIYNVKDKIWYDAGSALGARRSCGYTTEVFPSPIWCGWDYEFLSSEGHAVIDTPSGETAPDLNQVYLLGNQTPQFCPGAYVATSNVSGAEIYRITTSEFILNSNTPANGVTLITVSNDFDSVPAVGSLVFNVTTGYSVWQQEFGVDMITDQGVFAIPSSFTTCDISWVGGDPSQDGNKGINRRMHLIRVEPDFIQGADMDMFVLGRKFARGDTETNGPYTFSPDTGKIDLRLEHREIRLQFNSNAIGGNYEMGRLLITADLGDERP